MPLSTLSKDTTSELDGIPSHYLFNAERQERKLWIPTFNSLLVWLDEGIESRSTDYVADSLTTAPGARK